MSDYPNSGALFKNNRQRPGTKDPDRNGTLDVTCPRCNQESSFWLSGWLKSGAKGPFLSVSVKPKEAKPSDAKPTSKPTSAPVDDEDNCPF